ncbi:MAG: IMP dehydrogenase [Bdellovibrionota bacterium]
MTRVLDDISRTFHEYLLLPGKTTKEHVLSNVSLKVPLQKYKKGQESRLSLRIPFTAAAMQSVSGVNLSVALARKGGCSFVFCSQSIEDQARMVRKVKEHKAGFVQSDSNLSPNATLQDAVDLRNKTGHSTIPVTEDGSNNSKLVGILTSKDFWEFKDDLTKPVSDYYTSFENLVYGQEGISLNDATDLLWEHKKECLPIVDSTQRLVSLVFRRDYFDHKSNPDEFTDERKRLVVGAALNTFDYKDRLPALMDAGVDALVLDSSDGYSEWQAEAASWIKKETGDAVSLGGGNVVTAEAFRYLVEAGNVDFVKIGIGGGSICITREQKGLGRGQASAVLEVAAERDRYYQETGIYIPICSDGGLDNDTNIIMALALGADFVMMGKYFAMTHESPTPKITYRNRAYKPYWGEGSNRARNWQRYKEGSSEGLAFEEGVDAYVPYSGPLADKVDISIAKLKATMCNTGSLTIKELHQNAVVTRVSALTMVEGGTASVEQLDKIYSDRE